MVAMKWLLLLLLGCGIANAQTIQNLNPATTPLTGSELMYVLQNGVDKRVTVSGVLNGALGGLTITPTTGTLTLANGKTLTANNSLTLAGADGTTMTFPGASDTLAGLGTIEAFTAAQTFKGGVGTLGNGTGAVGASATLGALIAGQGSVNDVTIQNSAGTAALTLATGTTNWTIPGTLTVNTAGAFVSIAGNTVLTKFNLSSNPAYSSTMPAAFNVALNMSGTVSSGNTYANVFALTDNVRSSTLRDVYIDHVLGASTTGGRTALYVTLGLPSTTADGVNNNFYNAINATAQVSTNQGGTIGGTGSAHILGANINGIALSGATYLESVEAVELGVDLQAGSSAYFVNVLKLSASSSQVGINQYNALSIAANVGNAQFTTGISIGEPFSTGWPIASTGAIMQANAGSASPTMTAAFGIDFSAVTFSTAFLKSTGFLVDGSGNVTGQLYTSGSTAGVTCSGSPTSSFASTKGIVTHC